MGRPFTFPDIMYLQFCKTILLMIKLRYDIFRSVADPCTRQTYIIQLTDLCNDGQSISYSGFYHVIVMSTHKDRSSTKMIFPFFTPIVRVCYIYRLPTISMTPTERLLRLFTFVKAKPSNRQEAPYRLSCFLHWRDWQKPVATSSITQLNVINLRTTPCNG